MGPSCKIYALKRIRLAGRDPEAARGFLDEITLLKRLRNRPNIVQLIDAQVGRRVGGAARGGARRHAGMGGGWGLWAHQGAEGSMSGGMVAVGGPWLCVVACSFE